MKRDHAFAAQVAKRLPVDRFEWRIRTNSAEQAHDVGAACGTPVVVYMPGHLGDFLQSTPMLRRLRHAKPDFRILWLVGVWNEALARRYASLFDELILFSPDFSMALRRNAAFRQTMWQQGRIGLRLHREHPEFFVALCNENPAVRYLVNAMRPRLWSGLGGRRPPRVQADITTCLFPYEKEQNEADAMMRLLEPLGLPPCEGENPFFELTEAEKADADAFLRAENIDFGRPLVLISPGSGWAGKNWPSERFGAVAEYLKCVKNAQIAWLGTKNELSLLPKGREDDFNWMGRLPLARLAAVMTRATRWLGNDSGPMHLAAAVDCPTLSLWGPTEPAKWAPRGTLHSFIRKRERCPSCVYWDCNAVCSRPSHDCMEAIAIADVTAQLDTLL